EGRAAPGVHPSGQGIGATGDKTMQGGGIVIESMISRLEELNDSLLDDWTLRLIRNVYEHALEGYTMAQSMGYVAYRKRCAAKQDKEKARRVLAALRNNRWGLRDDVEALQQEAQARRDSERLSREAREVFRETIADAQRLIPEGKRGRGRRNGRKAKRNKEHRPAPAWTIS